MTTRIIINGEEVTSPLARFLLLFGAIAITALVTAVVIFVLFPIIGIALTLSVGVVAIFILGTLASVIVLMLITVISAWLFGSTEFRIKRIHRR